MWSRNFYTFIVLLVVGIHLSAAEFRYTILTRKTANGDQFQGGPLIETVDGRIKVYDHYIANFPSNPKEERWSVTFGSSFEKLVDFRLDTHGHTFVAGMCKTCNPNLVSLDICIFKLSPAGTVLLEKQFGYGIDIQLEKMTLKEDSNVMVLTGSAARVSTQGGKQQKEIAIHLNMLTFVVVKKEGLSSADSSTRW